MMEQQVNYKQAMRMLTADLQKHREIGSNPCKTESYEASNPAFMEESLATTTLYVNEASQAVAAFTQRLT